MDMPGCDLLGLHSTATCVLCCNAGRVWDMRTGRSIMALQGHVQGILTMDFSPDGYHLATGSEDHSCRIWDLRKRACVYVLPAHKSLISQVMLQRRCTGTDASTWKMHLCTCLWFCCLGWDTDVFAVKLHVTGRPLQGSDMPAAR